MTSKQIIENLLKNADVEINGSRPWDIKVLDERLYDRVISKGSLGLGEAYMDGWWDAQKLDEFFFRTIRAQLHRKVEFNFTSLWMFIKTRTLNLQTKTGSKRVAEEHYDLGNDLYTTFLDPYMQYSCGYFKNTTDLKTAQEQKLDLICRKLQLKKTDKVLDIGCGWGGFAKYAAEKYGCHVTGISISKEQVAYGQEFTKGLPVEIMYCDYRDITGTFDKIVSVGMFEHVGNKNYREIFEIARAHLKDDGLFLLHTIGKNFSSSSIDPWIHKYIFPNAVLPSVKQISKAAEGLFVTEDWHNFGPYYDKTLLAWYENFEKSWPKLKDKYGDRFYRMFRFYLLSCSGLFRARYAQLWQMVFSPKGVIGGYDSIR